MMSRENKIFRCLMLTINDFSVYRIVFGWSMHRKLSCTYCIENNKTFTLTNGGKGYFLIVTDSSFQWITNIEITENISLMEKFKGMLHHHYR